MPLRSPARAMATLLAVALALEAGPARAQTSPATAPTPAEPTPAAPEPTPPAVCADDLVNLRNGGMIRGKLIEVLPDDQVTIESATGQRRSFPWAEVAGYQRGGKPVELPTPAPELEPALEPGPGVPRLHIVPTRPAGVELYEITAETVATDEDTSIRGIAYRQICRDPCDRIIDARRGQSFFFGGDGLTNSPRFTLSDHSDDLVAYVTPGRRRLRFGGLITLTLGAAGLATGSILLALVPRGPLPPQYDDAGKPLPRQYHDPNNAPGLAIMAAGVAMLVGGVVMYVLGKTTYKFSRRGLGQRRPPRAG